MNKYYQNLKININDEKLQNNFLKYILIDNNNNKIIFSKSLYNKSKIYNIPLSSYLLILNKINLKRKPINKFKYESFIKKLIDLANIHKLKIKKDNKESNYIISEEDKEVLNILFEQFNKKIKELKNNYIYYINNKKYYRNDKIKLENIVDIPQKKEDLKNIYKDLLYIS